MVQPERLAHREKRRVFPISQRDARALDPARRFGSRPRYHPQLLQIRFSERQFNRPPPRRHIAKSFVAKPPPLKWELETTVESHPYDKFLGIGRLGKEREGVGDPAPASLSYRDR